MFYVGGLLIWAHKDIDLEQRKSEHQRLSLGADMPKLYISVGEEPSPKIGLSLLCVANWKVIRIRSTHLLEGFVSGLRYLPNSWRAGVICPIPCWIVQLDPSTIWLWVGLGTM